jgi:sec-independent protein translocase protein TatA
MGLLEPSHIIIIVVVLLLFFGGKGMKEFKDAQNGESGTTTTPTATPTEEKPKI